MKTLTKIAALSMMAILIASSCSKESIKTTYSTQDDNIQSYVQSQIKSNPSYYSVIAGGITRLVVNADRLVPADTASQAVKDSMARVNADSLKSDGVVSFYYAGYTFPKTSIDKSNLFATNKADFAKSNGWSTVDEDSFKIMTVKLDESGFIEGLRKGLVGVRSGEECYILFSGKHGYGDSELGMIPANSALAYHIWVESISNE